MFVHFDKLVIKNFKVFGDKQILNLRKLGLGVHFMCGENNDQPALGSNGAGKSTVWDAMQWCLTGKTVQGLRNNDVKPWTTKAAACVRLYVSVGDNAEALTTHKIERRAITNGLSIDGKHCAQEDIDRLIGLSAYNIPHTLILGQSQPLFFDLKPRAKLELLGKTLNIDSWEERAIAARAEYMRIQHNLDSQRANLLVFERQLTASKKNVEKTAKQSDDWYKHHAATLLKAEKRIKESRKALQIAECEAGKVDLKHDYNETEYRALQHTSHKLNNEVREKQVAQAKAQNKVDTLKDKLAEIKKQRIDENCPTCGQPLKNHDAAKLKSERKQALDKIKKQINDVEDDLDRLAAEADDAVDRLKAHRKAQKEFEAKSADSRDAFVRLQRKVAECKSALKMAQQFEAELQNEVNPYESLLAAQRAARKCARADVASTKSKLKQYEEQADNVKFWIDGFRRVRLFLLEEALQELQVITNSMLATLGLHGWRVEYAVEREGASGQSISGLNVMFFTPEHQVGVKWESCSGGEGQRLRVVGALALSEVLLRRAGVQCDLVVLDEPSRHMSREGISGLVDCLIERGRDFQIFYVDHQTNDDNRFASRVTVVRNDGTSRLVLE